jgi:hypothetical protein
MVERMLSMHEAQGSIPCSSTFFASASFCRRATLPLQRVRSGTSVNRGGDSKDKTKDEYQERADTWNMSMQKGSMP